MNRKQSKLNETWQRVLKRPFWASILVMVGCYVLLTAGMILATSPERYNLSVGDIATKTITATKDVIDEVTTEQRRERAAENVQVSYREDESASAQVLAHFDAIFAELEAVRSYGEGIRGGMGDGEGAGDSYDGSFTQAELEHARSLSTEISLSNWQATMLMQLDRLALEELYSNTLDAVKKQMESTIREGQVESAIAAIQRQILPTTSSDLVLIIAIPAVRVSIVPNMVVDQEATELSREAARAEAEISYYKSGQNIVVAGERVTAAQLAMLESLGLLEGNRFDVLMMTGVGLLSLMVMIALLFHVLQFDKNTMGRLRNAMLLATIFLMTMLLCIAAAKINTYFAPVSMVLLLVTTLLSPTLALTANSLALILVGVLTNTADTTFTQQMLYLLVSGVLSAPVGIYVAHRMRQHRASVLVAGILMALVNLAAMMAIGLLTNNETKLIFSNAAWGAAGNVLAGILCMGALPILEWAFNLVTPFKLVELSNPSHPLLRRLLTETPGTYHHSIMVANLAEAAAEAIGADPLLTRVGAYYHDIGKLKRPLYFKENQLGDNPHDRTDPRVSAAIIIDHVGDGAHMASRHRLPKAVSDFIYQHHGDSVVKYFYHKMLNMEGGENANVEDFQYGGPKPQSSETAIVMLADTVEAAIRAGGDQPAEVIEQRVRELIKGIVDGGQLNESPLCFADIQKIAHAFALVLTGIYHKRIEYPAMDTGRVAQLPPSARQTVQAIMETTEQPTTKEQTF